MPRSFRVDDPPSARAQRPGLVFALTTAACAILAIALSDDGWVPVLDSANLAFHEAGHVIFGLLGETAGLYGGTLGQLVFPVAVTLTFWRRRQPAGYTLGAVWVCENLFNIARYMADARKQELPLVGGGEHDWWLILNDWGLLSHDTTIAAALQTIAWCGLVGVWLWAGWRRQHR